MKNEDKMIELLAEMLQKQDAFVEEMRGMKNEITRLTTIQERQEQLMIRLLELMDDDVPKFDQVIDIENLKDGSIILKKHH